MDSVMSVSKDTTLQLHKMVNSPSKSETRSARTELWEFEEGRPTALSGYKKTYGARLKGTSIGTRVIMKIFKKFLLLNESTEFFKNCGRS